MDISRGYGSLAAAAEKRADFNYCEKIALFPRAEFCRILPLRNVVVASQKVRVARRQLMQNRTPETVKNRLKPLFFKRNSADFAENQAVRRFHFTGSENRISQRNQRPKARKMSR